MRTLSIEILIFIATFTTVAAAQTQSQAETYRWDVGAGLGMSGYLGDANESKLFAHPGVGLNASVRYLVNTRWAFRGTLTAASLSGNSADMENVLPGGAAYDFNSWIYDLGVRAEFNFFNYGIGKEYQQMIRYTPYLTLGLGVSMASVDGDMFVAPTLPMGFGLKYKLRPRLNLGLEFTMTKVFGDNIDGKELTDLYQIKSSFIKNTDWYSTIMLSISYEFGERCITCHRID